MEHDLDGPAFQRASAPTCPPRILRLKEVCTVTGLGRSFIYQLQAEKRFPDSIKIGARAVGWLEDEVRDWLADRVAASRTDKPDCHRGQAIFQSSLPGSKPHRSFRHVKASSRPNSRYALARTR